MAASIYDRLRDEIIPPTVRDSIEELRSIGKKDNKAVKTLIREMVRGAVFSGAGYIAANTLVPQTAQTISGVSTDDLDKVASYLLKSAMSNILGTKNAN